MYQGQPKQRAPKKPRGHGAVPRIINKGGNNRRSRMAFLARFGGRKPAARSFGRHVTQVARVPIIHPQFGECQREFCYHARKGWRSFLVLQPWTDNQKQALSVA